MARVSLLALLTLLPYGSGAFAEEPKVATSSTAQDEPEEVRNNFVLPGENVAEPMPDVPPPARRLGENLAEPAVPDVLNLPSPSKVRVATATTSAKQQVAEKTEQTEGPAPVVQAPRPSEETPDSSKSGAKASEEERKRLAREVQDAARASKPFLSASAEFRMLAITDETARGDRSLGYGLTAGYPVISGGVAALRLGLRERFVAEVGDSAFRFDDVRATFSYTHSVELPSFSRELSLTHYARLWLPTSRPSQANDLIVGTALESKAIIEAFENFSVGFDGLAIYRFFEYATKKGTEQFPNNRLALQALGFAEYTMFEVGDLSVSGGLDAYTIWYLGYAVGGHAAWTQDFGWDLYLSTSYGPHLTFDVSLEHGGSVLRDGIRNPIFLHRDQTELVFALSGRL
ncbi:MAG: hypothetical protein HY795_18495 [Desulfovibrio sp.]|nr:hypothetical protein [Desulfovibrio sp.]